MAKRRGGKHGTETSIESTALSRAYRRGAREQPPAHLDDAILATARAAVGEPSYPPARARGPFGSHWMAPLSAAATVVLVVGLTVFMYHEGAAPVREEPRAAALMEQREESKPVAPVAPTSIDARRSRQAVPEQLDKSVPKASVKTESFAPDAPASAPVSPPPMPETTLGKTSGYVAAKSDVEKKFKEAAPAAASAEKLADRAARTHAEPALAASGVALMDNLSKKTADVVAVRSSGTPGAYMFEVTVKSMDVDCTRYADWWEVVSEDGRLLYRRLLEHSHAGEQPFTLSGGPVALQPDSVVWVRAHRQPDGYVGTALKGSVASGFQPHALPVGFAAGLAQQAPLPQRCEQ